MIRQPLRLVAVLGLISIGFGPASASAASAERLQGAFLMRGTVTVAHHVSGERRGQPLRRLWKFTPNCPVGTCASVTLTRWRSSRHVPDVVVLRRLGPGLYVGRSQFWVTLSCAGKIVSHGGLAAETITVRVRRTRRVGATRFATTLSASYNNPWRRNLTACPGGIGRDAATYAGALASSLPGSPLASFSFAADRSSATVAFTDQSTPGRGRAPIVAWSWNFGDPSSPDNTSTHTNPTHRYSGPGTYTVTLRVGDTYGQSATTAAAVTI
jgi:hypothetical protein